MTTTIRVLPKDVVDRIAAGEVVQRPSNALKELLENSLDAGATKIHVQVEKMTKTLNFSIADNGHGIGKADLLVAATRFATSKLSSVDDFAQLSSFGFRGEALASISMVSHLTITSRTAQSPVAYECTYIDGKPVSPSIQGSNKRSNTSNNNSIPKRCARTLGTTVKVQDLFYNVPHRQKALNAREEYTRILAMLQPYAVQVAKRGVGIIVEQQQARGKTTKAIIDLNTTNLPKVQAILQDSKSSAAAKEKEKQEDPKTQFSTPQQQAATKQVIATIYGSHLEQHLLCFQSQSHPLIDSQSSNTTAATVSPAQQSSYSTAQSTMCYTCEGFLISPSLAADNPSLPLKHSTVLLFVNDRFVECPPLKRQLEEVYVGLTAWKKPPFVYLSLQVPASHVDVNVHPTKTQVALLFQDDVISHLVSNVQAFLADQGKTFGVAASGKPTATSSGRKVPLLQNPYRKQHSTKEKEAVSSDGNVDDNANPHSKKRKRIPTEDKDQDDDDGDGDGGGDGDGDEGWQEDDENENDENERETESQHSPPSQTAAQRRTSSSATASSSKPPLPSKMIRTHKATPVGALEPFLVKKSKLAASSQSLTPSSTASTPRSLSPVSAGTHSSQSSQAATPSNSTIHKPPCPFALPLSANAAVDMSQPGAFAQASQQCTCREAQMQEQLTQPQSSQIMLPSPPRTFRPTPVVPTECKLDSIRALRRRVQKRADATLQQKLRQAYFVGVVSEHRSLVQWQEELCLLHHTQLAKAMFYQLALARFGSNEIASFESPIHVCTVIENLLQAEENIQEQKINGTSPAACANDSQEVGPVFESYSPVLESCPLSETNAMLAKQATECLWENSAMLEEYFGIRLEDEANRGCHSQEHQQDEAVRNPTSPNVLLTGLPVLLDGHAPPLHGLALFLLRLAIEVNWEEERPCFDGVSRELGNYYAKLPSPPDSEDVDDDSPYKAYIQHTLFPALSFLLVPSQRLQPEVKTLTVLSNLYKVFERC